MRNGCSAKWNEDISQCLHDIVQASELTSGSWIAKHGGHVVSAKDIVNRRPDGNVHHVEHSQELNERQV